MIPWWGTAMLVVSSCSIVGTFCYGLGCRNEARWWADKTAALVAEWRRSR